MADKGTHYTVTVTTTIKAVGARKLYDTIEYDAQLQFNAVDIDDVHHVTKHIKTEYDKIAANHPDVHFGTATQ